MGSERLLSTSSSALMSDTSSPPPASESPVLSFQDLSPYADDHDEDKSSGAMMSLFKPMVRRSSTTSSMWSSASPRSSLISSPVQQAASNQGAIAPCDNLLLPLGRIDIRAHDEDVDEEYDGGGPVGMPASASAPAEVAGICSSLSALSLSMNCGNSQFLSNLAKLAALNQHAEYLPPATVADMLGSTMAVRKKFGNLGGNTGQFNSPHGFCLGRCEEIVVADTFNHRIQIFSKNGFLLNVFGEAGKEDGRLWMPRKVAVLPNCGHVVVCDRGNERSRMQVFSQLGTFQRKISIRYVDIVAGLLVSSDGWIVVVDSVRPTIFYLDPVSGQIGRQIDCSSYLEEPSDLAELNGLLYLCDFKGHSVVVIKESSGECVARISTAPFSLFPNGIDLSDEGDILIGDSHGNRFHVAVYDRNGRFVSHVHCQEERVSRCCGLKITSEGYIVTLAKNNHFVLVLDTILV